MYGVELYAAVRLAVVDEGLSHHEAGRRFGIDRRTVKKMLSYSAPPGYRRTKPVRRPKLDGFTGIVDAILEADTDPDVPRKQRHTAHRIFERLRDEHGFTGGYTIVKDYVRARRQSTREAFVPLHHPPGHAQVDFGEAVVEVGGRREKVAFFCLILPHSNVWFVKAYPRETTEAFLDGHVSAFAFLGGLPRLRAPVADRKRAAVRRLQPALRERRHNRDLKPALPGMDDGVRQRAPHRRAARPHHPPCPYPGDERRELPAQAEPVTTPATVRITPRLAPWAHRPLPRAGRRQPRGGRVAPRADPSHGLRGQAATETLVRFYAAAPVHFYAAVDTHKPSF